MKMDEERAVTKHSAEQYTNMPQRNMSEIDYPHG